MIAAKMVFVRFLRGIEHIRWGQLVPQALASIQIYWGG